MNSIIRAWPKGLVSYNNTFKSTKFKVTEYERTIIKRFLSIGLNHNSSKSSISKSLPNLQNNNNNINNNKEASQKIIIRNSAISEKRTRDTIKSDSIKSYRFLKSKNNISQNEVYQICNKKLKDDFYGINIIELQLMIQKEDHDLEFINHLFGWCTKEMKTTNITIIESFIVYYRKKKSMEFLKVLDYIDKTDMPQNILIINMTLFFYTEMNMIEEAKKLVGLLFSMGSTLPEKTYLAVLTNFERDISIVKALHNKVAQDKELGIPARLYNEMAVAYLKNHCDMESALGLVEKLESTGNQLYQQTVVSFIVFFNNNDMPQRSIALLKSISDKYPIWFMGFKFVPSLSAHFLKLMPYIDGLLDHMEENKSISKILYNELIKVNSENGARNNVIKLYNRMITIYVPDAANIKDLLYLAVKDNNLEECLYWYKVSTDLNFKLTGKMATYLLKFFLRSAHYNQVDEVIAQCSADRTICTPWNVGYIIYYLNVIRGESPPKINQPKKNVKSTISSIPNLQQQQQQQQQQQPTITTAETTTTPTAETTTTTAETTTTTAETTTTTAETTTTTTTTNIETTETTEKINSEKYLKLYKEYYDYLSFQENEFIGETIDTIIQCCLIEDCYEDAKRWYQIKINDFKIKPSRNTFSNFLSYHMLRMEHNEWSYWKNEMKKYIKDIKNENLEQSIFEYFNKYYKNNKSTPKDQEEFFKKAGTDSIIEKFNSLIAQKKENEAFEFFEERVKSQDKNSDYFIPRHFYAKVLDCSLALQNAQHIVSMFTLFTGVGGIVPNLEIIQKVLDKLFLLLNYKDFEETVNSLPNSAVVGGHYKIAHANLLAKRSPTKLFINYLSKPGNIRLAENDYIRNGLLLGLLRDNLFPEATRLLVSLLTTNSSGIQTDTLFSYIEKVVEHKYNTDIMPLISSHFKTNLIRDPKHYLPFGNASVAFLRGDTQNAYKIIRGVLFIPNVKLKDIFMKLAVRVYSKHYPIPIDANIDFLLNLVTKAETMGIHKNLMYLELFECFVEADRLDIVRKVVKKNFLFTQLSQDMIYYILLAYKNHGPLKILTLTNLILRNCAITDSKPVSLVIEQFKLLSNDKTNPLEFLKTSFPLVYQLIHTIPSQNHPGFRTPSDKTLDFLNRHLINPTLPGTIF
ncbi:hypothetical protein ACTFIR_006821 [Dictyostelium discoideum]